MTYDNHDKMVVYSFWMTILIVVYHLAPHLIDMLKIGEKTFYKQFFETFGSIALNYFFAVSAYKFFISSKTYKEKLKKRLITLLVPYVIWNSLYIILYALQKGIPDFQTFILGYTLTPFDGPLWYIFFMLSSVFDLKKISRGIKYSIIPLSIVVALFHNLVINYEISFPYDYWVERTFRMIPPFLMGLLFSEKEIFNNKIKYKSPIASTLVIICIVLATSLGDGYVTILLMYLCSLCLWFVVTNITLKSNSIIRNDMFIIYAVHEGIIMITLAVINKLQLTDVVGSVSSLVLIMIGEVIFILVIGFSFNKIVKRCPAVIDIMFTGGRNIVKKRL